MRNTHANNLVKTIRQLSHGRGTWQVFCDFCEVGAIAISNSVDLRQQEPREARYLQIVGQYQRDELDAFAQMLGTLALALDDEPVDVLGMVFHELELHSRYAGQFFTPASVARLMARMTFTDMREQLATKPFITACEPAVGGGAMVLGIVEAMMQDGYDYQRRLHVTAVDIDLKCVHMAYLQFSLLGLPAIVVHGNTLTLEERSHWFTSAHILAGWSDTLRGRRPLSEVLEALDALPAPDSLPDMSDPVPDASASCPDTTPRRSRRPTSQLVLF
jgi:hypothetical protein